MNKNKWFLKGGRGSGKTFRLLCEIYENKIAELEKDKQYFSNSLDKQIEATLKLDKENAELRCECRRCVYSDCPCILSDYGKDRNGICNHFKDVFDEIIELKEELKKWKDEWQEQVQKATDEGYARTLQTIQLTKAKELIENIIRVTWGEGWNYSLDWKVKAEQFLNSEVEK